jgi:hypothetical protein
MGSRIAAVLTVALVATTGLVCWAERHASEPSSPATHTVRLYDPNPDHLWNRLHAALFVRVGAGGHEYGGDRVDPLLWVGSTYLLHGPSHETVVKLLHEFVETRGERLIEDPLKHAVLQRDLWAVSDWLHGDHVPYQEPEVNSDVVRRSVHELTGLLATAIARLALTPEQIHALPDNYATAARAGALPADLLVSGGPWVSVGRPDGPVAAIHVRDAGPGKNSVFLVLIRLPEGRKATLQYLQRLRSFHGPSWMHGSQLTSSNLPDYPNPDLPQFAVGTHVALVRRALLIDTNGQIVPSPVTEQVQLRVYREIPSMTPQVFADSHRIDQDMLAHAGQEFEELSLNRAALFAHHDGGLVPLDALDAFFLTFSSHGVDEIEHHGGSIAFDPAQAKRLCKDCHGAPGVYSFNSYLPFRLTGPGVRHGARLSEISLADAERTAVAWKQQRADWRVLQPLLRQ